MSESLRLVLLTLLWIGLFSAWGAGPAAALGRVLGPPALVAPILGLALATCAVTWATLVLPMDVAAWTILLPGAVASVAYAAVRSRRAGLRVDLGELPAPLLVGAGGILLALWPGLRLGTVGPFGWQIADAWWHIPKALWISDHRILASPHVADAAHHRIDFMGSLGYVEGARVGVSTLNGAVFNLMGTTPDQSEFPLIAAAYGLIPVAIYLCARRLGAGRLGAAFGSLWGLSAATLTMTMDGAQDNIAGLVLLPVAFLAGGLALTRRDRGSVVMAAALAAGLSTCYPEFLPAFLGSAGLAGVLLLAWRWRVRGRPLGRELLFLSRRAGLVGAGTVLLGGFALERLPDYYRWASTYAAGPQRGLHVDTAGAWAFGVLHLYQLDHWTLLSTAKHALALLLPIALAVLVVVGAWRRRPFGAVVVLVPILLSVAYGLAVYQHLRPGCQYCLWKTLTVALPFLGIGLALGADAVLAWRGRRFIAPAVGLGAVALAGLVSLVYTDASWTREVERKVAYVPADMRATGLDARGRLGAGLMFLEGADAVPNQTFMVPALYYLGELATNSGITYDQGSAGLGNYYLWAWQTLEERRYADPRYRYVFTTFSSLADGRRTLVRHGRYAIEERRSIDAIVTRTNSWVDVPGGALPLARAAFQISVASPRAGSGRLRVRFGTPLDPSSSVVFSRHGRRMDAALAKDRRSVCVSVPMGVGFTRIDVFPQLGGDDAWRGLVLSRVRADAGGCPAPPPGTPPTVLPSTAAGFYPVEPTLFNGRPGQWMGTEGTIEVGDPARPRPRLRLRLGVVGFIDPRTITVTVDGRRAGTVRTRQDFAQPTLLNVDVPAGRGVALVKLRAQPGAASGTRINPQDQRRIAAGVAVLGTDIRGG